MKVTVRKGRKAMREKEKKRRKKGEQTEEL